MTFLLSKLQNLCRKSSVLVAQHRILIALVLFSAVLRMLWITLPVHGDEGEAGYNAMLWSRGDMPYVSREMDKPPMMYLLYLVPIFLSGNNIISVRLLNNVLFVASIIALYLLVKGWYGKRTALLSVLFYGLFMSVPAIEGPYALASSLSLPFLILSVYFCYRYSQANKKWLLFVSGILISIVSLIYQQSAVGVILLLVILAVNKGKFPVNKHETDRSFFRNSIASTSVLILGIILPISAFAFYFLSHGALNDAIRCIVIKFLSSDLGYKFAQYIPFDWALLTVIEGLPLLLFSIYGVVVCIRRFNRSDIYLLSWSLISMVLFLIEPTHFGHYALFMLPAASILSGNALSSWLARVRVLSVGGRSERAVHILVILIVAFSFVPSVYFQAKQYPNFSINWEGALGNTISVRILWRTDFEGGFHFQMEIVDYLKSLNVRDGEVLIHGWMPYLYWLSGLKAPSPYLCTVREWAPIPEGEYEKLLDMVREHKFKYIILSRLQPEDLIAKYTLANYSYVKSIGDVQIFS